ncbi:MAG: hypothetical protein QOK29_2758 [Rhodospirillaceae bacterium]|jgi:hypothetical protein|nr:hypothetical protein [Rhodospirillaceae bacterium]
MFKGAPLAAIAIALALCGQTVVARAGDQGSGRQLTQMASASGGGDQSSPTTSPSGNLYPVNNGSGRYICTPSGFGHLATCSSR